MTPSFIDFRFCRKLSRGRYLDKAKSHRHDRHSEDDVGSGGNHLEVISGRLEAFGARHQITEADRGYSDETIVGRRQPVPALPDSEQQRPHEDVATDQTHCHRQRNAHFLLFVVVVIIIIIVILNCNAFNVLYWYRIFTYIERNRALCGRSFIHRPITHLYRNN